MNWPVLVAVICEQRFSSTNHFTNVKAMNEACFKFYWLHILELNNQYREVTMNLYMPDCRNQFFKGTLHTKMNPKSKIRMESIALSINENAQQTKTQLNEKLKNNLASGSSAPAAGSSSYRRKADDLNSMIERLSTETNKCKCSRNSKCSRIVNCACKSATVLCSSLCSCKVGVCTNRESWQRSPWQSSAPG